MPRTILVIGADEAKRSALCSVLSPHFKLVEADSAQSAKIVLKANYVALSAVVLRVDNASEAIAPLERMKSYTMLTQLPIVVVTDGMDDNAELLVLTSGGNDCLLSTVNPLLLRQRIDNLIMLRAMSAFGNDYSKTKQTEQRLQAIMDQLDCGVTAALIDAGTVRILFSNNHYYEMLGYTKEDYDSKFGLGYGPVLPEDAPWVMRTVRKVADTGEPADMTYRAVKADGTVIWVRHFITVTHFLDVIGDVQLGVLYDITAEKHALMASQSKSAFLSRMSHDMRTPLNAILGLVRLAEDEANPPQTVEYLKNVDMASHFLLDLINDVVDLSKIESGKMELHEAPYHVEDFNRLINTMIRPMMEAKGLRFVYEMACGLNNIMVDQLRFNQIFINLLSNAVKYTPEGGYVAFTAEPIPSLDGRHGMRYRVKDNGIGMSPAFLKVIFEPFTQEKRDASPSATSSGLGLAIVKSIVEAMGGNISVSSTLGAGTEFVVDLYTQAATKEELEISEEIASYGALDGLRVLLADDTELNIVVAQKLLERKGCTVSAARDGQQAAEMFAQSDEGYFGVILMDARMPVLNGYEAAKAIRAMARADAATVPIIAMTADAYSEDVGKALEAGMNMHLTKPIDPEVLYATVSEAVLK